MHRRRGMVLLVCLAAALLAVRALAQGGLAYTVQVAALSDPEAAIGQSGALLRDGFPAYVVRAEGAAGTVFRVRVGAFGDRASADRYARAMGERAGGTPRPALAEAIPAGILPVAPTAVTRIPPGMRAVILPWEDGERVALRIGPVDGEARYRILGGDEAFDAWWATPTVGGREEIVRLPLDDAAGADDPADVREALFRQRLRLMAERSGLAEEVLAPAVRGEPGSRYLVAWRTVGATEGLHGLLAPGARPTQRGAEAWLGDVPPPAIEPLLVLQAGDEDDDAVGEASRQAGPDDDEPVAGAAEESGEAPAAEAGESGSGGAVAEATEEGPQDSAETRSAADGDPDADSDGRPPDQAVSEGGDDLERAGDEEVAAAGEGAAGGDDDEPVADEPAVTPADGSVAEAEVDSAPVGGGGESSDEAAPVPVGGEVDGQEWRAENDGTWTVLRVGDVSWRALVGAPRGALLDLLVLEVDGGLEIVRLVPR